MLRPTCSFNDVPKVAVSESDECKAGQCHNAWICIILYAACRDLVCDQSSLASAWHCYVDLAARWRLAVTISDKHQRAAKLSLLRHNV